MQNLKRQLSLAQKWYNQKLEKVWYLSVIKVKALQKRNGDQTRVKIKENKATQKTKFE